MPASMPSRSPRGRLTCRYWITLSGGKSTSARAGKRSLGPKSKRETRDQYGTRLRRTALRLPLSFIDSSIGDMWRRCQRLYAAKGHHFEEGGRGE